MQDLLVSAKQMETQALPQIQHQARTLDAVKVLQMVRQPADGVRRRRGIHGVPMREGIAAVLPPSERENDLYRSSVRICPLTALRFTAARSPARSAPSVLSLP